MLNDFCSKYYIAINGIINVFRNVQNHYTIRSLILHDAVSGK